MAVGHIATSQVTQAGPVREENIEIIEHSGLHYVGALASLHRNLQPANYVEIGTSSGTTLALASCASVAIDPSFAIDRDVIGQKPRCFFFQMTSDDFFRITT